MTYAHKHSSGLTLLIIGAGISVIETFCYIANIGFIYHYFWISPFLNGLISSILLFAGFLMFNKELSESLYLPQGQPPVYPSINAIQQPNARMCPNCGRAITENINFCPYCGKKLV
jgi:hypothetical protein